MNPFTLIFYHVRGRLSQHKMIFLIVKRFRKYAIYAGGLVVFSAACEFTFPLLSMYIIDNLIPTNRYILLNLMCLGMIFVLVSRWIANFLSAYLTSVFRDRILLLIQCALIKHIKKLPLSYFHKHSGGFITSQIMNGVWALEPLFADPIFSFARLGFILAVGILFVANLNQQMVVIGCISIMFLLIASRFFRRKLRTLNVEEQRKTNEAFAKLTESISVFYTEKIFVREKFEARRVFAKLKEMTKYRHKVSLISSLTRTLNNFIMATMSLIFLWYGGVQVMNGNLSIGEYVAINSLLASINGAAVTLLSINVVLHKTSGLLQKIYEILETEPEPESSRVLPSTRPRILFGNIRFANVCFSYDGAKPVLENVSFEVQSKQMIGIMGSSGVGKTTLINLIPRFYKITAGRITIDGVDIDQFQLSDLRRQVGIVPQEVFLFSGTITDNIKYGRPDATLDEVMQAAELAGIHSFIMSLPENYNTMVNENGSNFSIGQRQRLAIARAILSDPRILILDEATSALDLGTEAEVLRALETFMRARTTIIVSHRPSVMEYVDRVFILSDGCLLEVTRGLPKNNCLILREEFRRENLPPI